MDGDITVASTLGEGACFTPAFRAFGAESAALASAAPIEAVRARAFDVVLMDPCIDAAARGVGL